jgi:hypothetical protein
VLARATDVLWLDYGRALIMTRVIRRSLVRSITRREVWLGAGNVEYWRNWLSKHHPVWFTLVNFRRRRRRYERAFASPDLAHLTVHRLRQPREAGALIEQLRADSV